MAFTVRALRQKCGRPVLGGSAPHGHPLAAAVCRRPARAASCMGPGGPAPPVVRKRLAPKNRLNNHYSPVCVHPVHAPIHACPRPAPACIVLPRAAPQPMRPREPREPDTAEDAGGQTDHSGQAFQGGLGKDTSFHKPPSFKSSLNPFYFNFKVLIWTESSILAQDERWRRA